MGNWLPVYFTYEFVVGRKLFYVNVTEADRNLSDQKMKCLLTA